MILGIDISHWQDKVDFPLLKSEGIEFCICKASQGEHYQDPTFARHAEGAHNAGMIVGAYHWADPTQDDWGQIENFLNATDDHPISFAMVDVEQYWADWSEYPKNITKKIPPQRIEANAKNLLQKIDDEYPTLLYTRLSFCREYAGGILDWIKFWPTCLAQYPYKKGRVSVSWADFKANHLPKISGPTLPPGVSEWQFWQFTGDKFLLPGVLNSAGKPSALDVDYFNGSLDELENFTKGEIVTPEPIKQLRVSVPTLNIREGPGVQYRDIGDLSGNDIVDILDVAGSDAWVEIEPGKWACAQRGNEKYLVKD